MPLSLVFLFWYTGTGFRLQPQDEYTAAGTSKTLTTGVGYSFLDTFFNPLSYNHYQWYQSTDSGANWKSISGATNSSLTVTPTKPGTTYYQERFGYYLGIFPSIFQTYYYSRVASVTALGDPVSATGLSVTADDSYLYSNQGDMDSYQSTAATTSVHGKPTPSNATGDITWTSSNPSLAAVDKDSGTVTANTDSKSGTVTITGTIKNDDGTTKSGSVDIKVGGGLDDQTVDVGKAATFKVQGSFPTAPKSVVWYRENPGSSTATKVASGTSLTYTTSATTSADDNAKYYAEVTVASGSQSKVITTNTANLNVTYTTSPKVSITSKATDLTDNTGNSDSYLSNIVAGDSVEITGTITDSNADSTMKSGVLKIKVPANISNTAIYIDGDRKFYGNPAGFPTEVTNSSGGTDYYLVVNTRTNFTTSKTHTYKIDFQSLETTNMDFTTSVQLEGYDGATAGTMLDTYQSQNLSLNFSANTLTAKAGDVTFGSLSYANVNQDIEGHVEGGGNLLTISDDRRVKSGTTTISLKQEGAFETADGSHTLDATLSYTNGNRVIPLTGQDSQPILNAGPGIAVGSLNADHGQKLLLNMPSQAIYTGSYSTTLDWTISNVPS